MATGGTGGQRPGTGSSVFEPKVGGHIYDRGTDGSECRWARILEFDPPTRVVFSWDISPQWTIETDPENTSEVEVTFIAEGPAGRGSSWNTGTSTGTVQSWPAVSEGIANDQGWPLYLRALRRPADGGE